MNWRKFSVVVKRGGTVSAVLLSFFLSAIPASAVNSSEIVPERLLKINGSSAVNTPDWQKKWHVARRSVQSGNYVEAAALYAELVAEKSELEAARWEYCQLLVLLGRYKEAGREVALVSALAPDTPEYQLAVGEIALHNGEAEKAVQNFGAVLEAAPEGEQAAAAMKGLSASLRFQGRKELSLALEEQQMATQPGERDSDEKFSDLLDDALALNNKAKVSWILLHLQSVTHLSSLQLQAAIALLDSDEITARTAEQQATTKAYKTLLQRTPQNGVLRRNYISFLEKTGRFRDALAQFDLLLEDETEKGDLLLAAASVAEEKVNSPDKALGYYQRYLAIYPADRQVKKSVARLYRILAEEFLPIIENGSGDALWLDMEGLGSSRQEIFLQMAALLKERGERQSLQMATALLQFLVDKKAALYRASISLADVYMRLQEGRHALAALQNIPESGRGTDFYRKKAELLLQQGEETGAIEAYSLLLAINPQQEEIRSRAIVLCDSLGLIGSAEKFLAFYSELSDKQKKRRPPFAVVLLHLYFLGENRQLDSLREMADWAVTLWQDDPAALIAVREEEARALRKIGLFGAADQLLREQLNRKVNTGSLVFALAATAAERGRTAEMEQWFRLLEEDRLQEEGLPAGKKRAWRKALIKARLLLRRQQPEQAAALLTADIAKSSTAGEESNNGLDLQREIAAICQAAEQKEAEELYHFCRLAGEYPAAPWGDAPAGLYTVVEKEIAKQEVSPLSAALFAGKQKAAQRAWPAVEKILEPLQKKLPSSLLVKQLLTDRAVAVKEYRQAEELAASLGRDSAALCREKIFIARQQGEPLTALSHFYSCYGRMADDDPFLAAQLFAGGQPEEAVLLARLLWRAERHKESLAVYRAILDVPVAQQVITHYQQQKKGGATDIYGEKSFWDFLTVFRFSGEERRQGYEVLLSPLLLVENLGNSVGVMLAGNSHLLSLQKTLLQEYDARMASYERRLLYAEKSYRSLIAEEGSADAVSDLVAIYERMGQYQKEARLYHELEKSGRLNAILEKSMERNAQKITPLAIVDYAFIRKEGHNRYQDIEKRQIGSSFNYLLDLEKGLHFYYRNQNYGTPQNVNEIDTNKAGIDINWQFRENSEFIGGLGIDAQGGGMNLLWHGRIESQLDDLVTGFVGIKRERIEDTIASINAKELIDTISLGLLFDTPVGINFGGDLQYKIRSDDNSGRELHGFVGYSLFYEKSRMEARYDFFREENDRENPAGREEKSLAPVSYWSPKGNSLHRISGGFHHTFTPFWQDDMEKRKSSIWAEENFFSAEAGTGLESGGNRIYFADFKISLEISSHCLLKGRFDFLNGDERKETNFSLALQYRW